MRITITLAAMLVSFAPVTSAATKEYADFNSQILKEVEWVAANKAGLGYHLSSRYTEDISYGSHKFKATGDGKTMCVAAVFEIVVRALNASKGADGKPLSESLMDGRTLGGNSTLSPLPYIFQYKSSSVIPEYKRKFAGGIGDALVLFGMGRYVTFDTAKAGDFVYFNRTNGGGHAAIFMAYLDGAGGVTTAPRSAAGFRYFSAQKGGTNGMGYRDAFFGACPAAKTKFVKDCGVVRSAERGMFSVSRMHDPKDWYTSYSAIRVDRYFKGDKIDAIYADEAAFRKRGKAELAAAESQARRSALQNTFPLIVPAIAGENSAAQYKLRDIGFEEEFGPNFSE